MDKILTFTNAQYKFKDDSIIHVQIKSDIKFNRYYGAAFDLELPEDYIDDFKNNVFNLKSFASDYVGYAPCIVIVHIERGDIVIEIERTAYWFRDKKYIIDIFKSYSMPDCTYEIVIRDDEVKIIKRRCK